ncbi:pentapeptide repeat-containing protein [Roseibium sp.]|uniref:pentapeptide repeat-containing protein n=1 Tax=Roseibium sp. TaxID=1936156 RepID=UPI003B50F467
MGMQGPKQRISNQAELDFHISDHKEWLADPENNPSKRFNAKNIDFIGLNFSGDLRRAILNDCYLESCTFENVWLGGVKATKCDFGGSEFRIFNVSGENSEFDECDFSKIDFSNGYFEDCKFEKCVFISSKFRNVNISKCAFNRGTYYWVEFGDELNNVDFLSIKQFIGVKFDVLNDCHFLNCRISDLDFSAMQRVRGLRINESKIRDCVFNGFTLGKDVKNELREFRSNDCSSCELKEVKFLSNEVLGTTFKDTFLTCSEFHVFDLNLEDCSFDTCDLKGALIKEARAHSVDFVGSFLNGARFITCEMPRTQFANADLTGVEFSGCDMRGAAFQHAKSDQSNPPTFTGSTLDGASWFGGGMCLPGSIGGCRQA